MRQRGFIPSVQNQPRRKEKVELTMEKFLCDHITSLGVGLILSIAIFGAFKAGQVFERSTISERIHELDLEIRKQKTESKRKMLWKN